MKHAIFISFTLLLISSIGCSDIDSTLPLDEEVRDGTEITTRTTLKCQGNSFKKDEVTYTTDLPNGLDLAGSLEALGFDLATTPICQGECTDPKKTCVFSSIGTSGNSHVIPKKKAGGKYEFVYKSPKKTGDKVKVSLKTKCQCVEKKTTSEEEGEIELNND